MKGLVNEERRVCLLMDRSLDAGEHPKSDVIPVRLKNDNTFYADSSIASTEEFGLICNYVDHKLVSMGAEIINGNIAIEPHGEKNEDPCRYCGYKNICFHRLRPKETKDVNEEDEAAGSGEAGSSRKEILEMMRRELEKTDDKG